MESLGRLKRYSKKPAEGGANLQGYQMKCRQRGVSTMHLAFSSLSCPTWTLEQIVRTAVENGYDGVELRGLGSHMNLPEAPEFVLEQRRAVRARFADSGLAICCLGSSARFADPAYRDASRAELKTYMELAADLGCPFVRTFGGNIPQGTSRQEAVHAVAEELNALAP